MIVLISFLEIHRCHWGNSSSEGVSLSQKAMSGLLFSPDTVTLFFLKTSNLLSLSVSYVNLLQRLTSVILNLLWVTVHSNCELLIKSIENEEKLKQKS